jgi:hypothetical protein
MTLACYFAVRQTTMLPLFTLPLDHTRKSMIHLQLSPFARNRNPLHSPSSLGNKHHVIIFARESKLLGWFFAHSFSMYKSSFKIVLVVIRWSDITKSWTRWMSSPTRDVEGRPSSVVIDVLPPFLKLVHPFVHSSTLHDRLAIHSF